MAKKKDATALFEAISRARERRQKAGLGVPAWMGRPGEQAAEPAPEQPAEQVPDAEVTHEMPAEAPSPEAAAPQQAEPMISTASGRLRLSLNYVSCMVIFLGLLLLLAGAFALGQHTARRSPDRAPAGVAPHGEGPYSSGPPRPQRTVGKYYLVIQDMQGISDELEEQAKKIRDFCNANGFPATIHKWSGTWIVWSLRPAFESQSDPARLEFALKVEELGKRYLADGGRYNFLQRRGDELDPLMLTPRKPPESKK